MRLRHSWIGVVAVSALGGCGSGHNPIKAETGPSVGYVMESLGENMPPSEGPIQLNAVAACCGKLMFEAEAFRGTHDSEDFGGNPYWRVTATQDENNPSQVEAKVEDRGPSKFLLVEKDKNIGKALRLAVEKLNGLSLPCILSIGGSSSSSYIFFFDFEPDLVGGETMVTVSRNLKDVDVLLGH